MLLNGDIVSGEEKDSLTLKNVPADISCSLLLYYLKLIGIKYRPKW